MKPIARINFTLNGILYKTGQEVKIKTKEELIKLNEMGYIQPFLFAEINNYFSKNSKKESDKK